MPWLAERASALLLVPSAIIPFEQNVLINPLHPDSARLTVATSRRSSGIGDSGETKPAIAQGWKRPGRSSFVSASTK